MHTAFKYRYGLGLCHYHVETTLCHDIMTYGISLISHSVMQIEIPKRYNSPFFSLFVNVHTDMCDALILWLSCRLPDRGRERKTNYLCSGVMFQVHPHKCRCLLETICCKKNAIRTALFLSNGESFDLPLPLLRLMCPELL